MEAQEEIWWQDNGFWISHLQFLHCHNANMGCICNVCTLIAWTGPIQSISCVVLCIVCELKDVWQQRDPPWSSVSILCSIVVQDRVCIWWDVFVRVYYDKCWHANTSVYVVGHETFAETVDNNIIRRSVKGCQVWDRSGFCMMVVALTSWEWWIVNKIQTNRFGPSSSRSNGNVMYTWNWAIW